MMNNNIIKNKINWFPGHMKKATDEINQRLKNIDIVIEVVDARCINSSTNYELLKLINNKHYLKVALKKDLADLQDLNVDNNVLVGSVYDKSFRDKIINALNKLMETKINKLKQKGLMNPEFLVMVIGLPNVGKSSLINFLKKSNVLVSQNYPGVTKSQRIVKINQNYNLIDTPGVFIKNITDESTAYKLALIKCIKKEVLVIEDVLKFGFDFINTHYHNQLLDYYKINDYNDYYTFIETLIKTNRYLLKNNEYDYQKLYDSLYNDLSESKITKLNLDK